MTATTVTLQVPALSWHIFAFIVVFAAGVFARDIAPHLKPFGKPRVQKKPGIYPPKRRSRRR